MLINNGPRRIRTFDQWIMSPLLKNDNDCKDKDLEKEQLPTVAPAYKQNQKKPENLPAELAEIIEVWPDLPEYIKAAIISLVGTCS